MNKKSYFWQALTWCVAGTLVGTYFPRSNPSHRLHESIRILLMLYPAWVHLPLIAFLFLLFFRPAVDLFRRYRQNWHTGVRFFTIFDATVVFLAGWVSAALLNGSLPHTISGYSRSVATALMVWSVALASFLLTTLIFSYVPAKLANEKVASDDLIDAPITD